MSEKQVSEQGIVEKEESEKQQQEITQEEEQLVLEETPQAIIEELAPQTESAPQIQNEDYVDQQQMKKTKAMENGIDKLTQNRKAPIKDTKIRIQGGESQLLKNESQSSVQQMNPSGSKASFISATFQDKRSSVQPQKQSSGLLMQSPSQRSNFTLYGLQQPIDLDAMLSINQKQINLSKLNPADAANKFYDKHVAQALDKFRAQEIHLKHLQSFKKDIEKMKRPSLDEAVRFHVDEPNEIRKMKMLRARINGRNFRLNKRAIDISHENNSLQDKIDEINFKGSRNYDQKKLRTTNYNRTSARTASKGSLNYGLKKQVALQIDAENLRIASRILQQKATLTRKEFDKDYQKFKNTKEMLMKHNGLKIDNLVEKQRQQYKSHTIKLPEIVSMNGEEDTQVGFASKRESLLVKPGSLTAMMLEPAMKNLRETWMGAYYLKQLSKRSRTMELNIQAEAITQRISQQYKKLENLKNASNENSGMQSQSSLEETQQVDDDYLKNNLTETRESKEDIQAKIELEISGISDPRLLKKVMALLELAIKSDMSRSKEPSKQDPEELKRLETEVLEATEQ